jgi:hypothetical protein
MEDKRKKHPSSPDAQAINSNKLAETGGNDYLEVAHRLGCF